MKKCRQVALQRPRPGVRVPTWRTPVLGSGHFGSRQSWSAGQPAHVTSLFFTWPSLRVLMGKGADPHLTGFLWGLVCDVLGL